MPRIFFNLDEEELLEFEELIAARRRILNQSIDIIGLPDEKERRERLHHEVEATYNQIGVMFSNSRFYLESDEEEDDE